MKRIDFILSVSSLLSLVACAVTPTPIVQQPGMVRAQTAKNQKEANGAIFQAASYRPLFEDYKARLIGDVLTIAISENTSAAKAAASSGSKAGGANFSAPTCSGFLRQRPQKLLFQPQHRQSLMRRAQRQPVIPSLVPLL